MGSIYRRGSSFYVSYIDPNTGKRVRRSAGSKRIEAEQLLAQVVGADALCPSSTLSIGELLDEDVRQRSTFLKPSSIVQLHGSVVVILRRIGAGPPAREEATAAKDSRSSRGSAESVSLDRTPSM